MINIKFGLRRKKQKQKNKKKKKKKKTQHGVNLLILPTYTNAVYICKQAALQQMVMVCLHFCMYMYISMHLPGIHVGSISDTLCKHVSTRQPKFVPVVQIEDYPGLLNRVLFFGKNLFW